MIRAYKESPKHSCFSRHWRASLRRTCSCTRELLLPRCYVMVGFQLAMVEAGWPKATNEHCGTQTGAMRLGRLHFWSMNGSGRGLCLRRKPRCDRWQRFMGEAFGDDSSAGLIWSHRYSTSCHCVEVWCQWLVKSRVSFACHSRE